MNGGGIVKKNGVDINYYDWYDPIHIKAALANTIEKNNDQKPFLFVKSSQWDPRLFEEEKVENTQGALKKEFEQLFNLRKKTGTNVCYVRNIPKIEEGTLQKDNKEKYHPTNSRHWCVLYFFKDHDDKDSVLLINPGSEDAIAVDDILGAIQPFFQKKAAELYIYGSDVQDDMGSCGPVSVEFARALCNMSDNKKLFEKSLQEAKLCNKELKVTVKTHKKSEKHVNNTIKYDNEYYTTDFAQDQKYEIEYKTVNLNFLLTDKIKEDFKKNLTKNGGYNGKVCRDAHAVAADLIKDDDFSELLIGNENGKKFILDFVNKDSQNKISKIEEILCPVLCSAIVNRMGLLNQEQAQQKRGEILDVKGKKTVKIKLSDGHEKDPKELLSNEGKRSYQHTRENVKRKSISDSDNEYKKIPTKKSEFSKILATTAAFIGVALLGIAILIDIKKEFKIGGIVLSSIMLISAVTCFFLPGKTPDSKMTIGIKTPLIETTTVTVQSS